jgi:TrmH family RNA methyltransferase
MISKSQIKLIRSLSLKKFRDENALFVAEGRKLVSELLPVFSPYALYATRDAKDEFLQNQNFEEITEKEFSQITNLKNPQGVLAVFRKPDYLFSEKNIIENLVLALDGVQDPGNLGTIVRIADWFGISDVFCSPHTADVFSPKAIQATMGAAARVRVHYLELEEFIKKHSNSTTVYGAFLDGDNIYNVPLAPKGIIVMGNEGNGISQKIETLISNRLYIPNYPQGKTAGESLNVAIATALVCAEFRRVPP